MGRAFGEEIAMVPVGSSRLGAGIIVVRKHHLAAVPVALLRPWHLARAHRATTRAASSWSAHHLVVVPVALWCTIARQLALWLHPECRVVAR
jgi:hypothetical protein